MLGYLLKSNLPESRSTPPIAVPWPPMNLVAECTTIVAPCSIGLHRAGVAIVLSTIRGTPRDAASAATRAMSRTAPLGLPIVSPYRALVLGVIAASHSPSFDG